jgi:hypothetical protein
MRSGSLDRHIYFNRIAPSGSVDLNGVVSPNTSFTIHMRAELIDSTATDQPHGSGHVTETILNFRLRYLGNVKVGDRVKYNERDHEILAVQEIGRRKSLEIRIIDRGSL